MLKKVGIASFFAAATAALAVTEAYAECGGIRCSDVTVDRLYVHSRGISVRTSGTEALLDCDPGNGDYLNLLTSHSNYVQVARVLEDAHRNEYGIQIRIATVGRDEPCNIIYVVSDN